MHLYNYEHLAIFIKTVDCGSFSAAAKQMNTTHTTISRKMSLLEKSLNGVLFSLNDNILETTEFGKKVYDTFNGSIHLLDEINLKIDKLKVKNKIPHGTLRIQLPLSMPYHIITPNLVLFKRKYPQINLHVYYQVDPFNLVAENIDLAILNHIPSIKDQKYHKILSNKARLYCTIQYAEKYGIPKNLDELQNHLFTGVAYKGFVVPDIIDMINESTNKVTQISNGQGVATNDDLHNIDLLLSNEIIAGLLDSTYKKIKNDNIIPILTDYYAEAFNFYLIKNSYKNQVNIKLFSDFINECLDGYSK